MIYKRIFRLISLSKRSILLGFVVIFVDEKPITFNQTKMFAGKPFFYYPSIFSHLICYLLLLTFKLNSEWFWKCVTSLPRNSYHRFANPPTSLELGQRDHTRLPIPRLWVRIPVGSEEKLYFLVFLCKFLAQNAGTVSFWRLLIG